MSLDQLEVRLRALVDDEMLRVASRQKPERVLIEALIAAMHAAARVGDAGTRMAPNLYTLRVNGQMLSRWNTAELQQTLVQVIEAACNDAGLRLAGSPELALEVDPQLLPGELRVRGSQAPTSSDGASHTPPISERETPSVEQGDLPESAFLIVDGVKEFRLKQALISIGRRLDNDLVVDDPRVSRHHAQLRAIKGRYVLFDLDSSGGTFINGQRASQSILYPGDVISLAGVSLIFGQDNPLPQRDPNRTAPRNQAGAERATAIMRPVVVGPRKRP